MQNDKILEEKENLILEIIQEFPEHLKTEFHGLLTETNRPVSTCLSPKVGSEKDMKSEKKGFLEVKEIEEKLATNDSLVVDIEEARRSLEEADQDKSE